MEASHTSIKNPSTYVLYVCLSTSLSLVALGVLADLSCPALSLLVYVVTTVRARDRVDAARPLVEELRLVCAARTAANANERLDAAAKDLVAGGSRGQSSPRQSARGACHRLLQRAST